MEVIIVTQEHLMKQLSDWHKSQEHGKIIKEIEALPKDKQSGDILSLLARAFINSEAYSSAISTLESIKEADRDGFWCVRYGLALFISHREHEALVWFEKASEMGIEEFDELPGTYYPQTMSKWLERANIWAPRRAEKLAFENARRAARNKQPQESERFDDTLLEALWDDSDYSLKSYRGKAPSEADFAKAEEILGYRLPAAYKELMQKHNGGLLAKNTFENPLQCDWMPRAFSVESIFGVDAEKSYSLCGAMGSNFWIEEWGYPEIGIAICDTISGGHHMIFLDYSDCGPQGEPCVVEVDQESDYEITYLADDFRSFVYGLFEDEEDGE